MSKVVTPPTAKPANPVQVPFDKIAMRAYEKWCKRGMPCGTDKQDWYEAEAELRTEFSRSSNTQTTRR